MHSGYFRERQRYTKAEIAAKLGKRVQDTTDLLRRLRSYGVLKAVKPSASGIAFSDIEDDDLVVSDVDIDDASQPFIFDYVGVVTAGGCVFKMLPKYVTDETNLLRQLQQVLRVIRRHNAKQQIIPMAHGFDPQSPFNMLAIMVYIVTDYLDNGVYTNIKDITELNGEGEIDWMRTVNEIDPYVSDLRPVYVNLVTTRQIDDDADYFKRLHKCIAASCFAALKAEELDVLFSIPSEIHCDERIDDFGDRGYVLGRLFREMNMQFITRKQMLLRTMAAFISEYKASPDVMSFSMYGTNCFHVVWERVCAEVFGSVLERPISKLPVRLAGEFSARSSVALIDLIEYPAWTAFLANGSQKTHQARETLIPDIVSVYDKGGTPCFGIFDAKYYAIRLDASGVLNQPGVGDITKQYLYQLAYNHFIKTQGFSQVQNAFLFPSSDEQASVCGKVAMSILGSLPTDPKLSDILVVKLPASRMYAWYLNGRTIPIHSELPVL